MAEPRIRLAERDDVSMEARTAYDHVAEVRGGQMGNVFKLLANDPWTLDKVAGLGEHIRATRADAAINELAICVVAVETRSTHEMGHIRHARRAGVPENVLMMLGTPEVEKQPYPFGPIARFSRLVARGEDVDDATFSLLKEKLGDGGIVHLTVTVGYYLLLSRFMQTVHHPDEEGKRLTTAELIAARLKAPTGSRPAPSRTD